MQRIPLQVPAELFAIAESSHFEGTADMGVLPVGPDDYTFENPVTWSIDITNTGSAFLVEGVVTGSATCACARCLDDVTYDFSGDIEGYFLLSADAQDDVDEDELDDDEFDVLPDDHVIDLAPLLQAAIIMDAPEQPLCKDDCAGLCQQCGANLNEGPCDCGDLPDLTNHFAALANYSFD